MDDLSYLKKMSITINKRLEELLPIPNAFFQVHLNSQILDSLLLFNISQEQCFSELNKLLEKNICQFVFLRSLEEKRQPDLIMMKFNDYYFNIKQIKNQFYINNVLDKNGFEKNFNDNTIII